MPRLLELMAAPPCARLVDRGEGDPASTYAVDLDLLPVVHLGQQALTPVVRQRALQFTPEYLGGSGEVPHVSELTLQAGASILGA